MSPYLNFRGTTTNSEGHIKSIRLLPVKLNIVDESEVVSAIAIVFNLPASFLFLYLIASVE